MTSALYIMSSLLKIPGYLLLLRCVEPQGSVDAGLLTPRTLHLPTQQVDDPEILAACLP